MFRRGSAKRRKAKLVSVRHWPTRVIRRGHRAAGSTKER